MYYISLFSGYEDDSFLLAWYVKESADVAEATPLSPKSTQTLYELDMPTEPARCYLYLQDGPDSPPVRVAAQNSSVQTEGQSIELANSVTTTPSTHSVTYTNTWSTTHHYSNKSETGTVNHCVLVAIRTASCCRICGASESSHDLLFEQLTPDIIHDPRIQKSSL